MQLQLQNLLNWTGLNPHVGTLVAKRLLSSRDQRWLPVSKLKSSWSRCSNGLFYTAKVIFRVQLLDGQVRDLHGSVDKERSHQNVLLVRTPSLSQYHLGNHPIQAQVVVITGRNQMPSNPLLFDFIPNRKMCLVTNDTIILKSLPTSFNLQRYAFLVAKKLHTLHILQLQDPLQLYQLLCLRFQLPAHLQQLQAFIQLCLIRYVIRP